MVDRVAIPEGGPVFVGSPWCGCWAESVGDDWDRLVLCSDGVRYPDGESCCKVRWEGVGLEEWCVVPFVTDLEGINSGVETVDGERLEDW